MVQYQIKYLSSAERDLEEIFLFINDRSGEERAANYMKRIYAHCSSRAVFPNRGTKVIGKHDNLRKIGFERRIAILFFVWETEVHIARLFYGGRDLERIMKTL